MSNPNPDFVNFLHAHPSYPTTHIIDDLRATEYARLDVGGHIYFDYTGGGLYAETQVRRHHKLLSEHVFGNPHSSNPSSIAATQLVEHAREYVLKFFNANPAEYDVIFTGNASGALKLVGESYPFAKGGHYLLTFDNHNSVNGIREFAHARGAEVTYIPVVLPDMRVDASSLDGYFARAQKGGANLFAYPAQSNFSSVQHPLDWIEKAHAAGWDVLLDAAAFAPTNQLDLSKFKPDYVPLSFYKMFGYPTGIGALIARREALAKLHRPWFAGGTITVVSVQGDKFYMADGHTAFEDGTPDYLNIPAVEIGLKHIESIGYDVIHERVISLTGWLLDNLTQMKHSTSGPLVRIYGPTNTEARGGAVTVNFFDKDGKAIDHRFIESEANKVNISLRTGCFCNPGAGEIALGLSRVELDVCFSQPGHEQRLSVDDFRLCINGKSSGAVRISVGMVTNFNDVQAFLSFARGLLS
ncbi:MAG: aminotransferase class V-fold PLP-dependent enzyme [Chloroflexi bacterium]|nr:aminotransferase class V-fold PLP-dependent enzyme [Chloroflexota bacterium]MBI3339960.1 aminotransferase class V-fold PLP-dependent enzyme [Chloroflexota bacterium]